MPLVLRLKVPAPVSVVMKTPESLVQGPTAVLTTKLPPPGPPGEFTMSVAVLVGSPPMVRVPMEDGWVLLPGEFSPIRIVVASNVPLSIVQVPVAPPDPAEPLVPEISTKLARTSAGWPASNRLPLAVALPLDEEFPRVMAARPAPV